MKSQSELPMTSNQISLAVLGSDLHAASIAAAAAMRGIKTILIATHDLGEGASKNYLASHSANLSKLESLALFEVARNCKEESALHKLAPHWAVPTPYYIVQAPEIRSCRRVDWGLSLIKRLNPDSETTPTGTTKLSHSNLKQPVILAPYLGCRLQEQRLTLAYAKQLIQHNGSVVTRQTLNNVKRDSQWVLNLGKRQIFAQCLVNCSGAEVLSHIKLVGATTRSNIVTHPQTSLVVRKTFTGDHGYVLQNYDRQFIFITPINDQNMIIGPIKSRGEKATTDLIALYNQYFSHPLSTEDVIYSDTIERPLYEDPTRNEQLYLPSLLLDLNAESGHAPLLNVFGTDPTKHRQIADRTLKILNPFLKASAPQHAQALPGENFNETSTQAFLTELRTVYPKFAPSLLARLARTYGDETYAILQNHQSKADLGEHFGNDLYASEVSYLMQSEWAQTAEDVLWRRTDLGPTFDPQATAALQQFIQTYRKHHHIGDTKKSLPPIENPDISGRPH